MPLPAPTLDDRTFDQLVAEGRELIPRYAPDWTNHNVSDPGITLLELFAWLVETTLFELDQMPRETLDVFLELVGICRSGDESLEAAIARALHQFEHTPVAHTAAQLAERARELSVAWPVRVDRAELAWIDPSCPPPAAEPFGEQPAGLLNVVLSQPIAPYAVEDRLFFALKEHAVIGTRFHVVQARRVRIRIVARVVRAPGAVLREGELEARVREFIDPRRWQMGRPVYASELYQLLESFPAVDHVEVLELRAEPPDTADVREDDEGLIIPPNAFVDESSHVRVEVA